MLSRGEYPWGMEVCPIVQCSFFLSDDRREARGFAITQGIILNFPQKGNVGTIEFPDFSCRFVLFMLESTCRGTARPNENGKKENHFDA